MIVATTHATANEAIQKVRVSYVDVQADKAVLSIEDILASKDDSRLLQTANVKAQSKGILMFPEYFSYDR